MSLNSDFKSFCEGLVLDTSDMETTCGEIAKKLNSYYYDLKNEKSEHMLIVGSVGRKTAVAKTSDLDVIFDLPTSVYSQYNNCSGNGQSALLQEVKEVLQERYPNTDIHGDGQVVIVEFTAYTVELVPAFKQPNDKFKYPDTHDGGSWKITDPIAEQNECSTTDALSMGNFNNVCRMVRKWKNNSGVAMGGLLIDTLVYNHFLDNSYYALKSYADYFDMLKALMEYLKGLDKDQSYWLAVGSNQRVYNKDNGSFIGKAKTAYNNLDGCDTDDEKYEALQKVFGTDFPNSTVKASRAYAAGSYRNTEEFIEHIVTLDIRYNLRIDCKVTQNGFRDFFLSHFLRSGQDYLRRQKTLNFFIQNNDVPQPYSVWWKVCNVGEEAQRRDCIRGQVQKNEGCTKRENADFFGSHFVECYIIKNGVCVARDRINVPIGTI
jgi:hypothetical protein